MIEIIKFGLFCFRKGYFVFVYIFEIDTMKLNENSIIIIIVLLVILLENHSGILKDFY